MTSERDREVELLLAGAERQGDGQAHLLLPQTDGDLAASVGALERYVYTG